MAVPRLVPVSLAERSTDVELAVAAGGAGIAEAAAIRLDLVQQEVVVMPGLVADNKLLVDDIIGHAGPLPVALGLLARRSGR